MIKKYPCFLLLFLLSGMAFAQQKTDSLYHEQYRPQLHFSPPAHWMNDPNGLVYYKGTYNLFYQYYPNGTVWGPMHWGHATSTDLVHWKNKPIALYPDSLGLIFSGSAVVDTHNTSGFGKNGQPPMVAIFTQHNQAKEKDGKNDTENESMAYSNDGGQTWTKYAHNPVLKNPGISDFRDPKVMWYEPQKKWVMTLATKDHITFYSSKNLKEWAKESEFGQKLGAHGGVWECPDLFPMPIANNKKMWVLIVNINPGGPQGGSATQYFTGDFDGTTFKPNNTDTRWIDQGSDEYAGVTWSNTDNRRIFLGWMSNWQYATVVPTKAWRSAMTIPRELKLIKLGQTYYVASEPVKELDKLKAQTIDITDHTPGHEGEVALQRITPKLAPQFELDLNFNNLKNFAINLSNKEGERLTIGYDERGNSWYIDRTQAGESSFSREFAKRLKVKRIGQGWKSNLKLVVDATSIELFADNGLTVMTVIFFPRKPYDTIGMEGPVTYPTYTDDAKYPGQPLRSASYSVLKSIWP
jgi:fructan beta-fructosidase